MSDSLFASIKSLFTLSDEQAMWRVQHQDDPEAFAVLVQRWEKPIQRLCTRMIGDPHRAEDLAQEIFAKIFSRRAQYENQARFSTYLWRVAINRCHDELRRLERRKESPLAAGEEDSCLLQIAQHQAAPDQEVAQREQAQLVRLTLLRLPESYRSVVILRHYENLKFREIAEVLGIPEGTVKSRMAEALSLLNKMLTSQIPQKQPKLCHPQTKTIEAPLAL